MRWKYNEKIIRIPNKGELREFKSFSLFPRVIEGYWVWLEWYIRVEEYHMLSYTYSRDNWVFKQNKLLENEKQEI